MSTFYTDPNLEVTTIDDFTPGIIRFQRGTYPVSYAGKPVLGSATGAFRCYAVPVVREPSSCESEPFSLPHKQVGGR